MRNPPATPSVDEESSTQALDHFVLHKLDGTRGMDRTPVVRTLLGLLALQQLTPPTAWNGVRRATKDGLDTVTAIADIVEQQNPSVYQVFTKALAPDFSRTAPLLSEWVSEIDALKDHCLSLPRAIFGRWLGKTLDWTLKDQPVDDLLTLTPGLAQLLAVLADSQAGQTVLDPQCRLGAVLSAAAEHASTQGYSIHCLGIEPSVPNLALATLRLFFQGVAFTLHAGTALYDTSHTLQFPPADRVICVPSFGYRLSEHEVQERIPAAHRLIAPAGGTSAENLMLQYALRRVQRGGRIVALVPPGILFRIGADAVLRDYLLREDLVQAVIGLPANVVSGTAIEMAILVLESSELSSRQGHVLFVDAADIKEGRRARTPLTPAAIDRILAVYTRGAADRDIQARVVSIDRIMAAGTLLQPRHYTLEDDLRKVMAVPVPEQLATAQILDADAARLAQQIDSGITTWMAETL